MLRKIATGLAVLELARDTVRSQLRDVINTPRLWEHEIARYEAADRLHPAPRGGVVFTGSSTIRLWKTLAKDMAPLPVLNRGFGGAHLAHVTRFAPRIVLPYAPREVVLYCGDNDLGAWTGKTSATIVADFESFATLLHDTLPRADRRDRHPAREGRVRGRRDADAGRPGHATPLAVRVGRSAPQRCGLRALDARAAAGAAAGTLGRRELTTPERSSPRRAGREPAARACCVCGFDEATKREHPTSGCSLWTSRGYASLRGLTAAC
jgi:hypothetical protein